MRVTIFQLLIAITVITGCSKSVEVTNSPAANLPIEVTPGTVVLSWKAPSLNTDDTPLNDLASYRVHYGNTSGIYSKSVDVGVVSNYTIKGLNSGTTYYFVVAAVNSSGVESDLSNEIAKSAP